MPSRRQDYILYARYQNQLPLPPFAPKILNIPIPLNKYTETSYLSSLIQERPINIELDPELGMPLDLSMIPGVFEGIYDRRDVLTAILYSDHLPDLHGDPKNVKLDPKDMVLLKEVSSTPQRDSTGVSFLRRTEYISSESPRTTTKGKGFNLRSTKLEDSTDDKLENPEKQVAAIEAMFEKASNNWMAHTHPLRKNLTIVDSFPVFPDIDVSDQQFLLMKFTTDPGQNTISSEQSTDDRLDLALFMPVSARGENWLAYYLPEKDSYSQLKQTFKETIHEESKTPFIYNYIRNYDTTMHINQTPFDEIVLVFRDDPTSSLEKGAFYSPIYAKSTLKRRRSKIPSEVTKNLNVSSIELKLRPLNNEEDEERKKHCSMLDPYDYSHNNENEIKEEKNAEVNMVKKVQETIDNVD
ncbi:hypothetical protein PCK2_000678 [Pneumocystis canis]|nr:hypothetical protein PCK2_000678 [Pneumocystis canis]